MLKYLRIIIIVTSFFLHLLANAAPSGWYAYGGIGMAHFAHAQRLEGTTVTRTDIGPATSIWNIAYHYHTWQPITLNTGVGYFFNTDPLAVDSFGIELDYRHFTRNKHNFDNILVPIIPLTTFPATTTSRTNGHAFTIEAVYARDLLVDNLVALFKLGIGLQLVNTKIQTVVYNAPAGPPLLPPYEDLSFNAPGLAAGIGLMYDINKHWSINVEYDMLKAKRNRGYQLGLVNFVYHFTPSLTM